MMKYVTLKEYLKEDFWIMPATPKYIESGIPYITSKNIRNGSIDYSNINYDFPEKEYDLSLVRKKELEDKIKYGYRLENLTKKEIEYVNLAIKLPIADVYKTITWYRAKNKLSYKNEVYRDLQKKYHCSLNQIKIRVLDIILLMQYYEQELNNILKEQKKLIKTLKRNYEI